MGWEACSTGFVIVEIVFPVLAVLGEKSVDFLVVILLPIHVSCSQVMGRWSMFRFLDNVLTANFGISGF